tara:strand:- start:66 stop:242 length:177 start_codon:yes stop_codon:yes gene_type:complete
MSGDNLISPLPVKFYSEEMTETKKIIYIEQRFRELDEFIEKCQMLHNTKVFLPKKQLF